MARKTKTPRWLSIVRKLYSYIGISSLFTVIAGKYGISAETMLFVVEIYLAGSFAIQTICDAFYLKEEPLKDLPKDKI